MSDQRLKQLLKGTDIYTAVSSPLLLEGFALYYDTQTKNCIAQMKWRNIDPRKVKAVMIELEGVDSFGQSVGRVKYTYEGLDTQKNSVFGERVPIVIKTAQMARCDVFLSAVSFEDGTVWRAAMPMRLEKLPEAQPLAMMPDLREQYIRDMKNAGHGEACANLPQNAMKLWQCGCGSWQYEDAPCLNCGATREIFAEKLDPAALEAHLAEYKAEQERKRIEAEKIRIAEERKAEERRIAAEKEAAAEKARKAKIAKIALPILAVIIAFVLVFVLVIRPNQQCAAALKQGLEYMQAGDRKQARTCFEEAKSQEQIDLLDAYEGALASAENGDHLAAIEAFAALGDYYDAADRADASRKAVYAQAEELLKNGNASEAHKVFTLLGDYMDCESKVQECYAKEYEAAEAELTAGHIAAAHDAFAAIGEYADSADRAAKIESDYAAALEAMQKGEWQKAVETLASLGDYAESADKYAEACYAYAEELYAAGDKKAAESCFSSCGAYGDVQDKLASLRTELAADAMEAKEYAEALRLYLLLPQTDDVKALEYKLAQTCYDEGEYSVAVQAYETLGQYELAVSKLPIARYAYANQLFESGMYREAQKQFEMLNGTTDSAERTKACVYALGESLLKDEKFDEAKSVFGEVKDYSDAAKMIQECDYRKASKLMADGAYTDAETLFGSLESYADAKAQKNECAYRIAGAYLETKDYASAQSRYEALGNYADSVEKAKLCIYAQGEGAFAKGDYAAAETFYAQISGYQDASDKYAECRLLQGRAKMDGGDCGAALTFLEGLNHGDSEALARQCHIELGSTARASGNGAEAYVQYTKALPEADAVRALYDMGCDSAAVNDIPKAIECLWAAGEDEASKAKLAEISELQKQLGNKELSLIATYAVSDHETPENAADVTGDALIAALQNFTLTQGGTFKNQIVYRHAQRLLTVKNWDEAKRIFTALGSYEDSAEMVKECDYQKASALLANGDAKASCKLFLTIQGYKDVDKLLVEDDNLAIAAAAREAMLAPYRKVGNVVTYGSYEQDDNTSNGAEAIEWIVLDYDAGKNQALLISKYGLDAKQYHHKEPYPTWEKSVVRTWLNGKFLNKAFSTEEQKAIVTANITTPDYNRNNGGADTQDKIWLLSREEAEKYFKNDEARKATPTKYAVANGAYQYSGRESDDKLNDVGCCRWWLRSPGIVSSNASNVYCGGSIHDVYRVINTDECVRPAFLLNLDAL